MPSSGLDEVIATLEGAGLDQRAAVVSVAKGLVPPDGLPPTIVLSARFGPQRIACLGGPAHAQEMVNEGAGLVSARAFETRVTSKQSLQRLVYGDLKAMGLSAQPAIHVARKVCGAYAALRANIRAGNLGEPGSRRRVK